MTARGRQRAARLAVMASVAGLAGLALYAQPARRDAMARVGSILPAPSPFAPADPAPARLRPAATEAPVEAGESSAPADPAVVAGAEPDTDPAVPAVAEPGDIVVALVPPAEAEAAALTRVTYVHMSESAQPMGPEPLGGGGSAESSEGAQGPEPGALSWFGPEGLVRLAREARP